MIELATRNYWWLGVIKNIDRYIDRYNLCQSIKNYIEVLVGKLIANKVLERL